MGHRIKYCQYEDAAARMVPSRLVIAVEEGSNYLVQPRAHFIFGISPERPDSGMVEPADVKSKFVS